MKSPENTALQHLSGTLRAFFRHGLGMVKAHGPLDSTSRSRYEKEQWWDTYEQNVDQAGEIKQFWIRRAGRADQTMRDSNIKPDLILPVDCGITRHRLIRLCRGKRCEFFFEIISSSF